MIKKILSLVFILLLTASLLSLSVYADNGQEKAVYDFANIFTASEISSMEEAALQFTEKTDCKLYIVTTSYTYYWGEHFVKDYLGGVYGDAIVLIMYDNAARNYTPYYFGKPDRRISNSEHNDILDADTVYNNIKGGRNYDDAVWEFMRLSSEACEAKVGLAILIGCIVGAVVALITVICINASYKKKSRSEKYPLNQFATLELTENQDIFAGKIVTTRRINTGSSGGGRSGGSRGGGIGGGRGFRGGR